MVIEMKNKKSNTTIIILLIIIIIGILIIYISKNGSQTDKYKNQLIKAAQKYVQNNPSNKNEYYLDAKKLNVSLGNKCNPLSGVIVKNNDYQAYLKCNEYEDKILDNSFQYLKLIGDEVIFLPKGINYVEKGYNSSNDVRIVNTIKNEEGIYYIIYSIYNEQNDFLERDMRMVIIIDDDEEKNKYPILSLKGDEVITIEKGVEFTDPGITVLKNNITDNTATIKVDGLIDPLKVGEQQLTYYVTNSEGYQNSITRKVNVIDKDYDINVTEELSTNMPTNEDVTITLKITGRSYSYTRLPDNKTTTNTIITYKVNENGNYTFTFVNKENQEMTKTININNINRIKPTGSCEAIMYNDNTQVQVNSSSPNEINKYEYILNGKSVSIINSRIYQNPTDEITSAEVIMTDTINNSEKITCTITDKRTAQVYTDKFGKPCIKGYVCYQQGKYNERYCSARDKVTGEDICGPISVRGCSITSAATAISKFNKRSSDGNLYNPDTLVREITNSVCSSQCGWSAIKKTIYKVDLSAAKVTSFNKNTFEYVRRCLKNGPVIVHAGRNGIYTSTGGMHFLAILAIRDNGDVFIYNPGTSGNKESSDTWTTLEKLKNDGKIDYFMCVGDKDVYHYDDGEEGLKRDLGM